MLRSRRITAGLWVAAFLLIASSPTLSAPQQGVRDAYEKREVNIEMRDGIKLFTSIYIPRDKSKKYPFLMIRTPYSVGPYGPDVYRGSLGPAPEFMQRGYIFVYQDVRGRYMSEGEFQWMTPYKPTKGPRDTDESTDTRNTIDWLLKNVENNNGRVGMWGISFPGHYAAQALIDPHPALKAVSPQAPMADNWLGDDMHHNGAFFLPHAMNFISGFGKARTGPTQNYGPRAFQHGTPDGYRFFLEMGAIQNSLTKYNMEQIAIWKEWLAHGDYDDYWQKQNVPQHLKRVTPAVLTVGGWFDAEDLYGPLAIYAAIEKNNPTATSTICMGPWYHGSWSGGPGNALHDIVFEVNTGEDFRNRLQLPFFEHYLKDEPAGNIPEALMFDTGAHRWREFTQWPPASRSVSLYLDANDRLSFSAPTSTSTTAFDEYISDPKRPVPSSAEISVGMPRRYMIEDQRFVWCRPDVLSYETEPLKEDITLAGRIRATLWISSTGTDSDFVVKLIDVFPNNAPNNSPNGSDVRMGGYQMLIRGEPMRAKYRNSWSKPEPLRPGQVTRVEFVLPDVLHTFKTGHKIMVQIHSSWFPVVDRNPQVFTDIYRAKDSDFKKATQRVYRSREAATRITIGRIPG